MMGRSLVLNIPATLNLCEDIHMASPVVTPIKTTFDTVAGHPQVPYYNTNTNTNNANTNASIGQGNDISTGDQLVYLLSAIVETGCSLFDRYSKLSEEFFPVLSASDCYQNLSFPEIIDWIEQVRPKVLLDVTRHKLKPYELYKLGPTYKRPIIPPEGPNLRRQRRREREREREEREKGEGQEKDEGEYEEGEYEESESEDENEEDEYGDHDAHHYAPRECDYAPCDRDYAGTRESIYPSLPSMLPQLSLYFQILCSHVASTGDAQSILDITSGSKEYLDHLAELEEKYEWDVVLDYHLAYHAKRLPEMARGDYFRWGKPDRRLLDIVKQCPKRGRRWARRGRPQVIEYYQRTDQRGSSPGRGRLGLCSG